MSLRDRIRQESESGGFRPHPVGTFPGSVIEEIREREHDGQIIYEVCARTSRGIAKMAIWKTRYEDIDGRLLHFANGNRDEAEENYVKIMGRLCRLYSDLGLGDPSTDDGIESEEQLEAVIYDNLGSFVGRGCTVVVQANPQKPESPRVYINAPQNGNGGGGGGGNQRRTPPRQQQQRAPAQRPTGRPSQRTPPRQGYSGSPHNAPAQGSAFDEIPSPSLDDIPF